MYYTELKYITTTDIIKAVKAYRDNDMRNNIMFESLYKALKKYEGKKITKRVEKSARELLPESEYSLYYCKNVVGMPSIRVRLNKDRPMDAKEYCLVKHGAGSVFSLNGFAETNMRAGRAALERIKECNDFLANYNNVIRATKGFNALVRAWNAMSGVDFHGMYDVEEQIGLNRIR